MIHGIGRTIDDINSVAAMIASAVEEQGAATSEIARNVQEAADGTSSVSESIASVTESARITTDAAGKVQQVAQAIGHQTETLRQSMEGLVARIRT